MLNLWIYGLQDLRWGSSRFFILEKETAVKGAIHLNWMAIFCINVAGECCKYNKWIFDTTSTISGCYCLIKEKNWLAYLLGFMLILRKVRLISNHSFSYAFRIPNASLRHLLLWKTKFLFGWKQIHCNSELSRKTYRATKRTISVYI